MLIRHSLIYMIARFVPGILGMATTALLTHLLVPEQYGLYALALIVMLFGSTIAFDWLGLSFIRFFNSHREDPRLVSTFVQIYLLLVVATAVLMGAAVLIGAFPAGQSSIYAIGLVLMYTLGLFELVCRIEVAQARPGRYFLMNIGRSTFMLIGAGSAAWLTRDPTWTAIGTAIGTFAGVALGGFRGWRIGPRHFNRELAGKVVRFGLPLAASLAMTSLLISGSRALVEILDSAAALGRYSATYMLVQQTLAVAATGVWSATYAMAVRAVESGDAALAQRQLRTNGTILIAVLAPASIGIALTGHGIAQAFVGPSYVEAAAALTPWLAAASFFAGIRGQYLDQAFQLGRRPGQQVWVTGVAAVIAIGLSVYLIPRYGPLGAAAALMVAMAVSCVHAWIAGKHAYPVPLPLGPAARVFAACAVMALVVLAVPGTGVIALLLRVGLGGLTYAAGIMLMNVLEMRERTFATVRNRLRPRVRAEAVATKSYGQDERIS